MATYTIENFLPKTAAYINWVFQNDSKERGGHHNYVAEQQILNNKVALVNQNNKELSETDELIFKRLHDIDNNPSCVLILGYEAFTEYAEIIDIYGQGCNSPTKKGVDGFQVDFDVIAIFNGEQKMFHVVYQSLERTCNMMAYNGIEMTQGTIYGCDSDESQELIEFMDFDYNVMSKMGDIAKKLCFDWFELNCDEV